jgi:hypothetical protein
VIDALVQVIHTKTNVIVVWFTTGGVVTRGSNMFFAKTNVFITGETRIVFGMAYVDALRHLACVHLASHLVFKTRERARKHVAFVNRGLKVSGAKFVLGHVITLFVKLFKCTHVLPYVCVFL